MKSPITFKDWLYTAGVLLIACIVFLLLDQLPFISDTFDKIGAYFEMHNKYIY
ncbi:hypothetical protein JK636_07090 [Clostridium sp. YIM B02515]|uniref:Uncharacterized protein n=1 Tax=Clostridium rhizosphaerae TaxID=2803861 RepID=A0ABS1T864_9CLOT|nr:hypothetical protein [Clostridium rhizosphaerae]MBL4935522.1 hypothetical protein [Clostridium rhizosphaerae]